MPKGLCSREGVPCVVWVGILDAYAANLVKVLVALWMRSLA